MANVEGRQPKDGESEDGLLVRRTLEGDSGAFEALVGRYQRLVFRIAGGFLRDRRDVEDVAQEAYLRAFEALPRFRRDASFGPWIAQITTRLCYDRLRSRRGVGTEVTWEDLSGDDQQAASYLAGGRDSADAAATRDLAQRVLALLSPKDRQVLILREALGYSVEEAANIIGCTALAVRIRLHRAKRSLTRAAARLVDGMEAGGGGAR